MKIWIKCICCSCCVVVGFAVLLVFYFVLSAVSKDTFFAKQLENIESEASNIPAYVIFGELHLGDKRINISQLCRKQNQDYALKEIFCVAKNSVYFVYSDSSAATRTWTIAAINLETKTFTDCCQFLDAEIYYLANLYGEYRERNGFLYNGKIVLSDLNSVLTYEIETGCISMCDYDVYEFPQRTIYAEGSDELTINLHIDGTVQSFKLQKMAEKSVGIASVYAMRDMKTWSGHSYLTSFFARNRVQVISGEVYTIEAIMNFSGTPSVVILKYDQENNSWLYVTHCYAGDTTYNKCYLIESNQ